MSESKTRSSAYGSRRRKVAKLPLSHVLGKETGGTDQHSSPRSPSTTQEYVPNLSEKASVWDSDRAKALKAAVELAEAAAASTVAKSYKDKIENMELMELWEEGMKNNAQMTVLVCFYARKCEKLSEEAAESRVKISKLTQDLKEVQSEADLGKINLKTAEKLVEQAKQEKHLVEIKLSEEAAESRVKISKLTQDLKEVQSEVDLGKINIKIVEKLIEQDKHEKYKMTLKEVQSEVDLGKINLKIAEKLVEQAKQEKHLVELKSARKIQELEMELKQLKDRFKDAASEF